MHDIAGAIDDISEYRYHTLLYWRDGNTTHVYAGRLCGRWEVYCWSQRRRAGVDFEDVVEFSFLLAINTEYASKREALRLYSDTVDHVISLGAVTAS